MNNEDRIKLAEAMDWVTTSEFVTPHGYSPDVATPRPLPDPFTDANDDYACLTWMSDKGWFDTGGKARHVVPMQAEMFCYQIGDFARAALKVLDE